MNKQKTFDKKVWQRGLYMLLFGFLIGITKFVTLIVAVGQFIVVVLTGKCNANLLHFGKSISIYQYQILLFLTFNSESLPFPIGKWPEQ
jgi:hypothetical protein